MSVLGTVAAVVTGFFTGWNPQAMMAAYSIGSGVDAVINAPDNIGPRLDDLRTQLSTYGAPIPFEWGINRHAGTVMWPQTLDAVEHKHSESAKGGPDNITYTYTLSCAVLVCEGPIAGIRRIWANKKLVYDVSAGNTGATQDPAIGSIRIYLGSETQDADPLIEATDGPSPAYRGSAYVVFEDYDVTEMAGRPPQWEFEVTTAGTVSDSDIVNAQVLNLDAMVYNPVLNEIWHTWDWDETDETRVMVRYAGDTLEIVGYVTLPDYEALYQPMVFDGFDNAVWAHTASTIYKFDAATGELIFSAAQTAGDVKVSPVDGALWCSLGTTFYNINKTTGAVITSHAYTGKTIFSWVFDSEGNIWFTTNTTEASFPGEDNKLKAFYPFSGNFVTWWTHSAVITFQLVYDSLRNSIWFQSAGAIFYQFDLDEVGSVTNSVTWTGNYAWDVAYDAGNDQLWIADRYANKVVAIDLATGAIDQDITAATASQVIPTDNAVFIRDYGTTREVRRIGVGVLTPGPVALSAIVSDICLRANLAAGDIDVTQLTDMVDGYIVPRQMTARAAIEPLQQAFYFDAVESDDKIKFVKRGGAVAATIPQDERAAHEHGQAMPDALSIVRAFELELPFQCDVEYPDIDADHLIGNQYDRRITKDTKHKINLQLPIVMTAEKAKQVARVSLYQAWLNQSYRWTTTRKYAYLEPTDAVDLPTTAALYHARILSKKEQPNGVIEWEGRMEGLEAYTQSGADAAPTNYAPQTVFAADVTVLVLMDIPLLRDEDDNAGFYVAMGGTL